MRERIAMRDGLSVTCWMVAVLLVACSSLADDGEGIVRRGAEMGDSPLVDLREALADLDAHQGRVVTVEGKVGKVCQVKGCWMELMPEGEDRGVRVTFEDYGFFVPKDANGRWARLEGKFVREQLSKRDVDHLVGEGAAGEGAAIERHADGSATEFSFVARAVELRQPQPRE